MSLLAARLREAQAATAPAEVGLVLSQPSLPSDRQVAPARRPTPSMWIRLSMLTQHCVLRTECFHTGISLECFHILLTNDLLAERLEMCLWHAVYNARL